MLMALIEASGVVVGKDELLSRVWQDRTVEQDRQWRTITALRKGFSVDRELIPMDAEGVASSPARSARARGGAGDTSDG